jgi:VWFA-related protein
MPQRSWFVPGAPRVLAAVFLLIAGPQRDPVAAAPARPAPPPGPAAPAPVAAPGRPAPSVRATAAATPAAEPTYYEAIDVDVVNVEVFVADRHGNPILGLRPQDFTVLEDGKPVTITNFFSAVAAGADRDSPPPAAEPPAGEGPRPAPAAAAPAARGPDLPEEQRLDLAVLVDNSTLTPAARHRALRSLRELLASRLRPQDRVLVASYARELKVVQELTTDRAAVASVLERITGESGAGVQRAAEMRQLLAEMSRATPPPSSSDSGSQDLSSQLRAQAAASIRSFARQREQEGRAVLGSLAQFIDSLSGLPGRKALLYVTGGLSLRPGEALFRTFETQFGVLLSRSLVTSSLQPLLESREVDLTPLLLQVIEHANAGGVTLYPLLVGDDDTGRGAGGGAEGRTSMAWSENAATEEHNRKEPMLQLAAETGGEAALEPIEPADFLGRIQHDLSTYYSLGYASPHPHDGKVHRIKVKLRDPEPRLRHRAAYRDRTGADRIRDRTASALLFGVGENPLGIALEISGERRDPEGRWLLDLLVKIPMDNLVLLPGERFHQGRLTLVIGARTRQGWTSTLSRIELPIQLPNERLLTAMGQLAGYRTTLVLRPEETVLAVGVRDDLSQAESILCKTYVPGQAVAGGSREGT